MTNDKDRQRHDGRLYREAHVETFTRSAEGGDDGKEAEVEVRVSISSETPYRRTMLDPESGKSVDGYEVLGHGEGEIDFSRMSDGLVIQDTHWGDQVGIMRSPEVKDGKISGVIEFGCGARAQEIKRDAAAGIRRNMSVGYMVGDYERAGEAEDGLPIFRVTKWTPYEASFVNVPADTNVGVGRVLDAANQETRAAAGSPSVAIKQQEGNRMKHTAEQVAEAFRLASAAHVDASEVNGLLKANAEDFGAVRDALMGRLEAYQKELAAKPAPQTKAAAPAPIFDAKDEAKVVRQYNILNVIRALAKDGAPDVGFEREVSQEIAKRRGTEARGFYVPESVFVRAMTGKTNVSGEIVGNGAATVEKTLLTSQYIDELVAQTVLGAAGVSTVGGLVGDIAIPKGTAVSAGWIAEKDTAAEVSPTFSQVEASPHTAAASAVLSRRLMLQSAVGVQNLVSRLILEAIGRAVETAAFDGTGADNQPTGLAGTSGIGSVAMTAGKPTHANLVEFWEKVYTANAAGGAMKYIGSPAVKALLCKTLDVTTVSNGKSGDSSAIVGGVGAGYLCSKDGQVEGFDFLMSGLCNAKKLYFGNWSEMLLAFWSGVDMTVDPYTYSNKGAWRVTAFQDCDVVVRHPGAFAVGTALA